MSLDTITITAARQREAGENDYNGPDGTRSAMLIRVGDPVTEPSTMGKKDTWTHRTWTFAIDDGSQYDGQVLDCRVSVTSSNSDKSKQFQLICALFGRTPPVGTTIDIKKHLLNRSCYVSIKSNDAGYPYIETFMAKPENGAKPTPAPEPVAVAAGADDLPF